MMKETSSPQSPRGSRLWLWVRRIVLGVLGLVVLAALAGATYEALSRRRDERRFPQQGRSVDVGGYRLNIDCNGSAVAGAPTVILESGLGVPGIGWKFVQKEVAKFARVCSYDRAGYGWSDPARGPRSSLQITKEELHTLLQNAGVAPPYLLVGHSFGGFNIRVFHGLYPQEVAGAVFVDSSEEDQIRYLPADLKKFMEQQTKPSRVQKVLVPVLGRLGIVRLSLSHSLEFNSLPAELRGVALYLSLKSAFTEATTAEMASFEESAEQVRASGTFGTKPLIALTAGKSISAAEVPPGVSKKELDEFHELWVRDLQVRLAHLSTRGKQIIVPNSGQMIPFEQSQAVVSAIREVLAAAQTPGH